MMRYVVGMNDSGAVYADARDNRADLGEVEFPDELQAIEYAVDCTQERMSALRAGLRVLRQRQRALSRRKKA